MSLGGSYESALIRAAAGWNETDFLARVGFEPIPGRTRRQPGDAARRAQLRHLPPIAAIRERALALLERAFRPDILRVFCAQTGQSPPTISATRALEEETEPFLHADRPAPAARPLPSGRSPSTPASRPSSSACSRAPSSAKPRPRQRSPGPRPSSLALPACPSVSAVAPPGPPPDPIPIPAR